MFLDWLNREGLSILSWWLMSLLAGIAVFPLCYRLLHGLPGRGYALARAAGLLLIGFTVWLPNNLGLLDNSPGSTVLAWLIIATLSAISYFSWSEREPIGQWISRNLGLIISVELLFAVMFLGWATYRAMYSNLTGTEKPMEMAFLSASRRSASFPPHDPWFSGYAISYYHFGYIIIALLANMTGVSNGTAFNLGVSLLFALTGVGAFGVAYELVASRLVEKRSKTKSNPLRWRISVITAVFGAGVLLDLTFSSRGVFLIAFAACAMILAVATIFKNAYPAIAAGLLAALFAVFMGNLGVAMIELPYNTRTASEGYLNFMAIEERDSTTGISPLNGKQTGCIQSGSTDPATWCNWWWFRDSRVVRDLDLSGEPTGNQPITEFPNFSFVLADMHPHILSMPFFMLVLGLALNLVLGQRRLYPWEILIYAIAAGGMIFLNSWDAVLLGVFVGAEALRRLIRNGTGRFTSRDWFGIAVFGVTLLVLIAVLYLPFFIGFRSQAGGILPNVAWQTQFQQFFLMFGVFLVILVTFLLVEAIRAGRRFNLQFALQLFGSALAIGLVAMLGLIIITWNNPNVRSFVFQVIDQSGGLGLVLSEAIARRAHGIVTQVVLLVITFLVVARLFPREPKNRDGSPGQADEVITYSPSTGFVLLLIAIGALLTLAPDFIYLRDGFGTRINTVFKFYFQTWLLWSIASAYAVWSIAAEVVRIGENVDWRVPSQVRIGFGFVATVLIILGMLYPPAATMSRAFEESGRLNAENQPPMTLDGGPSLVNYNSDEYRVIQCLATVARSDTDVVAEATRRGLAYNWSWGRVSALTGIPTLLGWDNHEGQWRGDTFGALNTLTYTGADGISRTETRYDAIATLYNTQKLDEARSVIQRYGITYVYVGGTERSEFDAAGLAKFKDLVPVCSSGSVAVYAADSIGTATTASK